MIQDYEVKHAVQLGGGEVIFAENENTPDRYMVCDCSWDNPLGIDLYRNGIISADFVEMTREFSRRITERAEAVMTERAQRGIPFETLTAADCHPKGDADLEGQVVVIRPEKLAPEYQTIDHQLALCVGGFGANPNARGRTVFCTNLYTGKTSQWNRGDIAGTVSPDRLPDWAKKKLAALRKPAEKESVTDKLREGVKAVGPRKPKQNNHDKGGPER